MKRYLTSLFCSIFLTFTLNAQYGGVALNTSEALDSYTLLQGDEAYYLINNCGEIINSWVLQGVSYHPKLLPNGNILYQSIFDNTIYEKDWDGNTVVSYQINDPGFSVKYEVIKMPNGNYLVLGRRGFSTTEFNELGWNINWGFPSEVDAIVEYSPTEDAIVWKWNIIEHVIQEESDQYLTFGVVKDHPELLNMAAISTFDWEYEESFMINGMDYNPELDQIALSIRKLGEVGIIDHSTTTEEAAGHTGGVHDKGGDFIYRWGSPGNYNRETADQKKELYLQHNPKWITSGVHKGKISIYNNMFGKNFGSMMEYSSAYIIDPPIDSDGFYSIETDQPYGPIAATLKIDNESTNTFFRSNYGSGVEVLPNENIFISNATGRLMECTMEGNIVWEYNIPFTYFAFRSEKYAKSFPAFAGKDLTPKGQIPGATEDENCVVVGSENIFENKNRFSFQFDPVNKTAQVENLNGGTTNYVLYSLDGKSLQVDQAKDAMLVIDLNQLTPGMYFISLGNEKNRNWESHKVMVY